MADFKRPLPNLKEHDTREFWQATKDGKLTYQKCVDCGTVVFYPRHHCTACLGSNLSWHTASGRGTVYSFSVVRKAEHPFFRGPGALCGGVDRPRRRSATAVERHRSGRSRQRHHSGATRDGGVGNSRRARAAAVPSRVAGSRFEVRTVRPLADVSLIFQGTSAGWMSPWRRQPVCRSQVRAGATSRTSAGSVVVRQPSNQRPELAGSG